MSRWLALAALALVVVAVPANASGISGKGLRGYPGLSLVFHDAHVAAAPDRLPRYLDLGFYVEKNGVPFTLCSNLLYALKAAAPDHSPDGEPAGKTGSPAAGAVPFKPFPP